MAAWGVVGSEQNDSRTLIQSHLRVLTGPNCHSPSAGICSPDVHPHTKQFKRPSHSTLVWTNDAGPSIQLNEVLFKPRQPGGSESRL